MVKDNEEQKEEFCSACLTVPIALAAGGGGIAGSSAFVDKKKHQKIKKALFIIGITIAVLSIAYSAYVLCKQTSALAVCS